MKVTFSLDLSDESEKHLYDVLNLAEENASVIDDFGEWLHWQYDERDFGSLKEKELIDEIWAKWTEIRFNKAKER